jgi:hypothetical protein
LVAVPISEFAAAPPAVGAPPAWEAPRAITVAHTTSAGIPRFTEAIIVAKIPLAGEL